MSSGETKQNRFDLRFAGMKIAKLLKPVASGGSYTSGGRARYPSKMIMHAAPAKVAGAKRNFRRYTPLVLASVLLIALIPFLGIVGRPLSEGPEPASTLVDEETASTPKGSEPRGFSCRPTFELAKTLPFSIDTNSTINSVNLSAKSKELTVVVQGPDDSIGVFCINIPKAMFGDRLKVTLDDLPVNAKIDDYGENNVVTLMYSHSRGDQAMEPETESEEPEGSEMPEMELKELNYLEGAERVIEIML